MPGSLSLRADPSGTVSLPVGAQAHARRGPAVHAHAQGDDEYSPPMRRRLDRLFTCACAAEVSGVVLRFARAAKVSGAVLCHGFPHGPRPRCHRDSAFMHLPRLVAPACIFIDLTPKRDLPSVQTAVTKRSGEHIHFGCVA